MKTPEDEKIDQRITRAINEYGLLDKIRECDPIHTNIYLMFYEAFI
jgi:hypothetical protein